MAKLNGSLPKGQANGLSAIARQLVDEPDQPHVVIAIVDTRKIATDCDTGDQEATVRVRRIEPISGDDGQRAATLLRRAMETRTGQTTLPIEVEEEIEAALGSVSSDPDEGNAGE